MNQEDLSKLFDVDTSGMGDDRLVELRNAAIARYRQGWVRNVMMNDLLESIGGDASSLLIMEMASDLGSAFEREMEEMVIPFLLAIDMEGTAAQVMDGFSYEEIDSRERWEHYIGMLGNGVESYRQSVELMRPVWNDIERMADEAYSGDIVSEWLLLSNDERYTGTLMVLGGLALLRQAMSTSDTDISGDVTGEVGMFVKRIIRLYFRLYMSFSAAAANAVDRKWDKG